MVQSLAYYYWMKMYWMKMRSDLEIYKELNILCVDDDIAIIEIYQEMFSLLFKNVYTAYDGESGYASFLENRIDIVLTDHAMPVLSGLGMSKKIREKDGGVPIIMLTALENLEMLREAIDIRITSFIKKPLSSKAIFSTLSFVAKSVLADRILLNMQKEQILYSTYQEKLTYDKERVIIKNDLVESQKLAEFVCEVFYKPRDILSGDSYIIRKVSQESYFLFIVDGMGKGISASATAMLCSAFINRSVDLSIQEEKFSLKEIVRELIEFIGPNLLDEEVVSASFFYFNESDKNLEYAMFSMPAALYMLENSETVLKIKSNNPPLVGYTQNIKTSFLDTKDLCKILLFSDGLNENSLKNSNESYAKCLSDDFKDSKEMHSLELKREEKIEEQEDDITYIFLHKESENVR